MRFTTAVLIAAKNLVTNPAPAIHVSSDRTDQSSQNQHEITFDKKAEGAGVEPARLYESSAVFKTDAIANWLALPSFRSLYF